MKSYYIHLIRNGLTAENTQGRYVGHMDVDLSEEGAKQLDELAGNYVYPDAEAVFTSPLKRCVHTAERLYHDKTPIVIPDLIECNFGEFEGLTAEELKEHPVFPSWLAGEEDVEPPFGESNREFAIRVCGCFEKIVEGLMKTGTTSSAVVTHGGVIMLLMSAYGLPSMPMHEWLTPNGCGYTVRITPTIWMRGQKFEAIAEIPAVPGSATDDSGYREDDFNPEDYV